MSARQLLTGPDATWDGVEDVEAATALSMEQGWGDGLPIVPPTVERVERMLAYCDRPWHEPIATVPPRSGAATPVRIAANAVMAGCKPEYFPLVLLAVDAMCEPAFNLYGIQTTTHPACPLAIFNGPLANAVGLNGSHNAFGPGFQANAAIGRALRLVMLNIGGAIVGVGDMATMGHPGKYGYVVAENEEATPWEPLHVERGFARETTTVTMVGSEGPHNINDHHSICATSILTMVAGGVAGTAANNLYYVGAEPVIALSPEHAATVAGSGFSKEDAKRFLFQNATIPLRKFSPENIERRFRQKWPERYAYAPPETRVPLAACPEDYLVIVLGGVGKHSMYIPNFGESRSITKPLARANGTLVHALAELRS